MRSFVFFIMFIVGICWAQSVWVCGDEFYQIVMPTDSTRILDSVTVGEYRYQLKYGTCRVQPTEPPPMWDVYQRTFLILYKIDKNENAVITKNLMTDGYIWGNATPDVDLLYNDQNNLLMMRKTGIMYEHCGNPWESCDIHGNWQDYLTTFKLDDLKIVHKHQLMKHDTLKCPSITVTPYFANMWWDIYWPRLQNSSIKSTPKTQTITVQNSNQSFDIRGRLLNNKNKPTSIIRIKKNGVEVGNPIREYRKKE